VIRARLRTILAADAAVLALVTAGAPAQAQMTVYDPANYTQNLATATRALTQITNQIQMLQNQTTSLINQARNLTSLNYSSLSSIQGSLSQTQSLLALAQRIAYSGAAVDQAFTQVYPQSYSTSTPSAQMVADAQTRWLNALGGYQDAMRVQAGVVQNLASTASQTSALVSASQSATGALQAAQSGNQLIALQTKQLVDITAVMAAIARAQSLAGAQQAASQAQSQQQLSNFLNYGAGYQPGSATMFH
jgi:P-type conjugative transfer protein TrbJ